MTRQADQRDRRRAYYLGKVQDERSSDAIKLASAFDFLRALIASADPEVATRTTDQLIRVLLATAATLDPTKEPR